MLECGEDVISLGTGEPSFEVPSEVKDELVRALRRNETGYTEVEGTENLRLSISKKFKRDYSISYDTDQIIVSNGSKQVVYNALLALIDPGDEVVVPVPYWGSYPEMVKLVGGEPKYVYCDADLDFSLSSESLKKVISPKTKCILLNFPNNPSGSLLSKETVTALTEILNEYPRIILISDEIYQDIHFAEERPCSIASQSPELYSRTLTVSGVSKSYSMAGFRIGYAGGPKSLIKAMVKLQGHTTANPCSLSQAASIAALNECDEFILRNNEIYKKRLNNFLSAVKPAKGLKCIKPRGAFYVFISCRELIGAKTQQGNIIKDDIDFSMYLLDCFRLAVVPGSAFGVKNHFRVSMSISDSLLVEAASRLVKACSRLEK
nr:pyridoxal phosphate-dependent aminotransferase [Reinekea sp. G2M2-21]